MPKPASKAVVVIEGATLDFTEIGNYTIDFLPSGSVKIKLDDGHAFVMRPEAFDAIETLNVSGITFHEADGAGAFEPSRDLNDLLGALITERGIDYTIDHLTINGNKTDAFKMLWDYLDDAYVAGGNPFNVALNETFVRLGVAYVDYLEAGGEPLTFVTAKFTADNGDAGTIPEREQSMHDNLLGNLTDLATERRFDDPLKSELQALIPQEYRDRPYYEGTDNDVGHEAHDAVRAFDYDHGWDRPDYLDRDYDAFIDPLSHDRDEMFYGDGNTIGDWNVVRHEGAQVELGLKIKHRQGGEYDEVSTDADGVAHYDVQAGTQPGNPDRAEWNFDFAAADYSPDDDFTYAVELDIDPTEGVDFITVYGSGDPDSFDDGTTFQNSSNIAFFDHLIDTDPEADGIQAYSLGEGEFNVRISAYDAATNSLVAVNEVVVHVGA